jgi:hypothetical protein
MLIPIRFLTSLRLAYSTDSTTARPGWNRTAPLLLPRLDRGRVSGSGPYGPAPDNNRIMSHMI